MKKNSAWKITWVIGIYAILVSLLYLVVIYKVEWEDKDLNKYLYFYPCNNQVCTTDNKVGEYYSSILCKDKKCPYVTSFLGNVAVVNDNNQEYLFNYIDGTVINNKYSKYKLLNDKYYIVGDKTGKYGIIDTEDNLVVDIAYSEIADYQNGFIVYKENDTYGIDNPSLNIMIDPVYNDVILMDSEKFAYKENGVYHVITYTGNHVTDNTYDYIYSHNGTNLVIKNSQLDILDNNMKSKLLLKINTYYSYKKEKERDTLNIKVNNSLLSFSVYAGQNAYKDYVYDLKNNKLFG